MTAADAPPAATSTIDRDAIRVSRMVLNLPTIGKAEAWALLRDTARAPEGFVQCCKDAGTDPDLVALAIVNILAKREPEKFVPNCYTCTRCTRKLASLTWEQFQSAERDEHAKSVLCCFCRDADLAAAREEARRGRR